MRSEEVSGEVDVGERKGVAVRAGSGWSIAAVMFVVRSRIGRRRCEDCTRMTASRPPRRACGMLLVLLLVLVF